MNGFLERIVTRTLGNAPIAHRRREPLFAAAPRVFDEPFAAHDDEREVNARTGMRGATRRPTFDDNEQWRRGASSAGPFTGARETRLDFDAASIGEFTEIDDVVVRDDPGVLQAGLEAQDQSRVREQSREHTQPPQTANAESRAYDGALRPDGLAQGLNAGTVALQIPSDIPDVVKSAREDRAEPASSRQAKLARPFDGRIRQSDVAAVRSTGALQLPEHSSATTDRIGAETRTGLAANRRAARAHIDAFFDRAEADPDDADDDIASPQPAARQRDENVHLPADRIVAPGARETSARGHADELTINVSIDRIDVTRPAAVPFAPAPARAQRTLSDYMNVRAKMRGR